MGMMIRSTYTLVLAIVTTLVVTRSVADASPKPTIAVLGLEVQSATVDAVDADVAKAFTAELRVRARQASGPFQLAPGGERELIDEKVMNGCNTEAVACMAAIGKAIPADQLMYGKIERGAGDSYKITIRLLNLSGSSPATNTWGPETITEKAAKTSALKLMADKAYDTLVGVSSDGTLTVKSSVEGAKVFVNDEEKGEIRGGALLVTLPENRYHVAVEAKGYKRWEADTVTIRGGQNQAVDADLVSLDMSHEHGGVVSGENHHTGAKVAAGIGFGVAAVAAGAFVYEYVANIKPYRDDVDAKSGAYLPSATGEPLALGDQTCSHQDDTTIVGGSFATGPLVLGDTMDSQVGHFRNACKAKTPQRVAAIVGGIGLVAGVTFLFIAMRDGDDSEQRPANSVSARKHRKRSSLAITPIISAQGGGASVRFDW